MISYSCDICGQPAEQTRGFDFQLDVPLQKLHGASLAVCVRFSFKDHPTGFGGPPDLCQKCFKTSLESALRFVLKDIK